MSIKFGLEEIKILVRALTLLSDFYYFQLAKNHKSDWESSQKVESLISKICMSTGLPELLSEEADEFHKFMMENK